MDRRKDVIHEVTGPAISGLVLSALYMLHNRNATCDFSNAVAFVQ
jgi:hypothetical protein